MDSASVYCLARSGKPDCSSLIRLSAQPQQKKNRILFANPDSRPQSGPFSSEFNMKSRDDLRVRLSYDEGKTWPVAKLLQEGGTGYSDMAVGKDGTIYILYEHATPMELRSRTSKQG